MMTQKAAFGAAIALLLVSSAEGFVNGPMALRQMGQKAAISPRSAPFMLQMALKGDERVAVLGAFERIGVCAAKVLTDSAFKPYVQVQEGFTDSSRVKWPIDGQETLPNGVNAVTELPICEGAILASEEPAEPAEIEFVLKSINGLQKVVFLSKAQVTKKDDFINKLNPFNKLQQWYDAEEAVKKFCDGNEIEYTIVRAGKLEGGPFYNSNKEFQSALEGNLFDMTNKAMKMSAEDSIDGVTGRDLAGCALVQALSREVPTFSIVSAKEGSLKCSVENHMGIEKVGKDRKVYTPTDAEWDAAFSSV